MNRHLVWIEKGLPKMAVPFCRIAKLDNAIRSMVRDPVARSRVGRPLISLIEKIIGILAVDLPNDRHRYPIWHLTVS